MSRDQQLSFFDFDDMSDSDRHFVESILCNKIQSKAVELPWKEELTETFPDNVEVDYSTLNSGLHDGQQIQFIQVPPPVSHCIDMSSVCMAGAHFYPQPLYVFIDPSMQHQYIYQGLSTAPQPVLTNAGYMAPIAHMMPQMPGGQGMVLAPAPGMMQPVPHTGSMVMPGPHGMMIQSGMMTAPPPQAAVCMMSPPHGNVVAPPAPHGNGLVPHGSGLVPPHTAVVPTGANLPLVAAAVPTQIPITNHTPASAVLPLPAAAPGFPMPPPLVPIPVPVGLVAPAHDQQQAVTFGFEMPGPCNGEEYVGVPRHSPAPELPELPTASDTQVCPPPPTNHINNASSPLSSENTGESSLSDADAGECYKVQSDCTIPDDNDFGFVMPDAACRSSSRGSSPHIDSACSHMSVESHASLVAADSEESTQTRAPQNLTVTTEPFHNGHVESPPTSGASSSSVSATGARKNSLQSPTSSLVSPSAASDDGQYVDAAKENQWPTISMSQNASTTKPSANHVQASKPKVSSWASLLKDTASAANAIVISADDRQSTSQRLTDGRGGQLKDGNGEVASVRNVSFDDAQKLLLADLLKSHRPIHRSVPLQPRGLTNRANWCYVNATLQALLACPPFYHLMKLLPPLHDKFPEDKSIAVMRSMVEFVNNFSVKQVKAFEKQQSENAKGTVKLDIKCGSAFEPVQVYKMLQIIDYGAFKQGQQEDAEEFLSCILNRLHDEMVSLMKLNRDGAKPTLNGGEGYSGHGVVDRTQEQEANDALLTDTRWEQVRSRNRTIFNNSADNEPSPISAIFRGQICSILHQLGQKESATLQSFFTLQLDVQNENVKSVKEALEQLVSKESLQGYTCAKSKVEVDATQRMLLEELPPVLVLHLKWFIYDKNGGMQKCIKQVDFDIDLEIGKDLLSVHAKAKCSASHRKYKLFAVVNHIGARAIGGHYTVDVFHPGYNCWLRCDDDNISSVPAAHVTKFSAPKVPYLIFYRRIEPS